MPNENIAAADVKSVIKNQLGLKLSNMQDKKLFSYFENEFNEFDNAVRKEPNRVEELKEIYAEKIIEKGRREYQ